MVWGGWAKVGPEWGGFAPTYKRNSLRECYLKSPHPVPPLEGRRCIAKVWSAALLRGEDEADRHRADLQKVFAALMLSLVTPPRPSPQGEGVAELRYGVPPCGGGNLQRRRTLLIRSPPMADGLSRHLYGDVITPVPPPPAPSPTGRGSALPKFGVPPDGGEGAPEAGRRSAERKGRKTRQGFRHLSFTREARRGRQG